MNQKELTQAELNERRKLNRIELEMRLKDRAVIYNQIKRLRYKRDRLNELIAGQIEIVYDEVEPEKPTQ